MIIDNYEEISQRLADEDKPIVMAKIEKTLYDWANEFEGLMIKAERDTFVVLLEKQYMIGLQN